MEDNAEVIPEGVARYTLMNGSSRYFRLLQDNELYAGKNKEVSSDFIPVDVLCFAGELDNSLYFYTELKEKGDEEIVYTFYKSSCAKPTEQVSVVLERIGKMSSFKPIQFATQQPYCLRTPVFNDGIAIRGFCVMSFNGEQMNLPNESVEYAFAPKSFIFFVRKSLIFIVVINEKNGTKISTIQTRGKSSKSPTNTVLVQLRQELSLPQSIYAQDNSLIYILTGKTMIVVQERLEFAEYEIRRDDCKIGGVRDGKLLLNAPGVHFEYDLGEDHRKLATEVSRSTSEDEGFGSAENSTESPVWSPIPNEKLEKENKRLRLILEQMKLEKKNLEEKARKMFELSDDSSTQTSTNRPFTSKFAKEFEVIEILGSGNFGCVFEAQNKFDEWKYAVKRIAIEPKDEIINRALREVRAMAQFDHPGIVNYNSTWIERPPEEWQYQAEEEMLEKINSKKRHWLHYKPNSAFIYIQMQLCNFSLSMWLSENNIPESRKLSRMKKWFKQIVSAVDYIHGKHLIHRDLKPCNILFVTNDLIKICDLGIVTERKIENGVEITMTRTEYSGTTMYMSPEQNSLFPALNAKSDVFTLGLILAELCVVMTKEEKEKIFNNFRKGKQDSIFGDDYKTANFIKKLTDEEKKNRPTCREMLDDLYLA